MRKFSLLLSVSLFPLSAQAITTTVPSGTTQSGGDVMTIITQQVYGTADNFTVSGTQQVMSGGVTHGSIIYPYGQQTVESGGISYNTNVEHAGLQTIKGKSYNSNVSANGTINVNNGGYAYDTTVNGGTLSVLQGGNAEGTILVSGTETVYGTDTNANIQGGTQQVKRYGKTFGAEINGGTQQVEVRGTANNTVINSGIQNVYGDAMSTSINDNGTMNVYSSGYAEDTIVNGGKLVLNSGAFASQTILEQGEEIVYGQDINGTVKGGTQLVQDGGVAEDTTISGGTQQIGVDSYAFNNIVNGGTQIVESGGYAYRSQISSGGSVEVSGGIYEASLENGGTLNVLSGGLAQDTAVSGGSMSVAANSTAQSATLSSGSMSVSGTDTGTQITGGTQTIENGGKSENAMISGSGVQTVLNGGTSTNAQISSGGTAQVSGEIYGASLENGGTLNVLSGGLAQDTAVSGGSMSVAANSTAQSATLSSGSMSVSGTDTGTQITGGTQTIENGGKSENAMISGSGVQTVLNGRTSTNAQLKAQAIQNILEGGTASGTQIGLGGKQTIASGGTAINSTLTGGTQFVSGLAQQTIINGGLQEIRSGGVATDTQITRGGIQTVLSGATATNSTFNNGTLRLFSGGSLNGVTTANNSILYISGNNQISNMELNNSIVSLAYNPNFTTLNVDKLNGNGVFSMSSNLAAGLSDQINVQSGDGKFGLIVHDYSDDTAPAKFQIIDGSNAAQDNFYLIGGAVDVGAYRYDLVQEGSDWYLENTKQLTDATYIARNTYTALSSLFFSHLSPVYNRLHYQHQGLEHDYGLWVKGIGRRVNQTYHDSTKSHTDIWGESIGFDGKIIDNDTYRFGVGIYSGFTNSHQNFDVLGKGDGKTYSLGLYSTMLTSNMWFVDVMGTYFRHHQKNQSYTPAMSEVVAKFETEGWQTAVSAGRRFDFSDQWFLTPYAAMNYMYINGVSYKTNYDTPIRAESAGYLSNTLGLTLGKSFNWGDQIVLDAYSQANLIYDWDAKNSVWIVDHLMEEDMASLHYELSLGINASFTEHSSAYVEFTSSLGSKVDIPWALSLGYQYEF